MSLSNRQTHAQLMLTPSAMRGTDWQRHLNSLVRKTRCECSECHGAFYPEHFADEQPTQTKCLDCRLSED